MSGIAQKLVGNDLFQRFIIDGTWKKPAGINTVCIECIGAGGGGGGGLAALAPPRSRRWPPGSASCFKRLQIVQN